MTVTAPIAIVLDTSPLGLLTQRPGHHDRADCGAGQSSEPCRVRSFGGRDGDSECRAYERPDERSFVE
ncbi:MAG: hypothetical protein M3Y13_13510 [Armatimonadota bacterium]|nr:hypothetical protein [Armatimonadota bacterium]